MDLHKESSPFEKVGIVLSTRSEKVFYGFAIVIGIKEIFGESLAESSFFDLVFLYGGKYAFDPFIIFGDVVDEKTIKEIIEIIIARPRRELVLEDTRQIEVFDDGGI